jgi:hypothetical protein
MNSMKNKMLNNEKTTHNATKEKQEALSGIKGIE